MARPPSLQVRLAQTLRKRREALGLSQKAFANQIGVHRTYWGAVERGKQNLTLASIERFAEELDVSVSALFAEADRLLEQR